MKFGLDQLIKAMELSFDLRKIHVQLVGMIIGLVLCLLFLLVGAMMQQSFLMMLFIALAVVSVYVASTITQGCVCRMIFRDVVSGEKVSFVKAFKFGWEKMWVLVLSPLGLILMISIVGLIEYLIFLMGRIPAFGPIILAILLVPLFITNVILVLIFLFGLWLIPAIVAIDETNIGDTLRTIYQAARKAPILLLIYLAVSSIMILMFLTWMLVVIFDGAFLTSLVLSEIIASVESSLILSIPMWITLIIGAVSLFVAVAYILSYLIVLVQTIPTSIYMAVKERIS